MPAKTRNPGTVRPWRTCWAIALLLAAVGVPLSTATAGDEKPNEQPAGDEPAKESKAASKEAEKPADARPAEGKADPKKPAGPPPKNPLTELIKRTLQPRVGVPLPPMPGVPPATAAKRSNRNAADSRAPYDKRAADWM